MTFQIDDAGMAVARRINRRYGEGSATFISVDLAEPNQVRSAAKTIKAEHLVIDILINNAGARNDEYRPTSNGHELTFACNHLGHFLLTCLLLDRLIAAPAARIITISSDNHGAVPKDGDWELPRERYDRRAAYARSKMANIVFSSELARRLRETRITANVYVPGGVASGFARNNGLSSWLKHVLSHLLKRDLSTPGAAASGLVKLACEPGFKKTTGRYVHRSGDLAALSTFHMWNDSAALWAASILKTELNEDNATDVWPLIKP